MSKYTKKLLYERILEIVTNTSPWKLYIHMEHVRSGAFSADQEQITFYHRQIVPYVRKKIGFNVSAKDVKIALAPLKKENYFLISIDK